ncbi:MAG: OsmC family protein [Spirochaetales bacterium]|nr:OsmC family protein [Spirochaetales bacterium]
MSEKIIVRQNRRLEVEILAADTEGERAGEIRAVGRIHDLTPYGLLLAGLGTCTAVVVHTYARSHDVPLERVEVVVEYTRDFQEDCEHCEEIEDYEEAILEEVGFEGNLREEQRDTLERVAALCSIRKMLESGVPVMSREKGRS